LLFKWPILYNIPADDVAVVCLVSTAVRWTPWKPAGGVDAQPITWRADHSPIKAIEDDGEYRAWNRWDADALALDFETKQSEAQGWEPGFDSKKWLNG